MSPKIIAVVGATGNQGSSVVNTFLQTPNWTVRALTRNTSSPAAQALASKGCEVVRADLEDPASLEDAFRGVHAIFLNTDFWIPYIKAVHSGSYSREEASRVAFDTEVRHAKNATDAAVRVASDTLERLVYSALGPMKDASGGKFPHCQHWNTKALAADYIEAALPGKASFIYPGAYSTNAFLLPQKYPHLQAEGVPEYTLLVPGPDTTRFPIIREAESMGPFVRPLIEEEDPGVKLLAYDCDVPFSQALEDWKAVTGKDVRFLQVTEEEMHRDTGLPYEVLDGPAFLAEYDFMAGVKGRVIRPEDLKSRVPVKTYREILEARPLKDLLESVHPKF